MSFGCPICSEKLDKLPAEAQTQARNGNELSVSATPCGHVFHSYCIDKWLKGNLASSKQCPCCRKPVPKLRCLALFPTSFDDSILDDSLPSGSAAIPIPCNHAEIITTLKGQLNRIQAEVKEKDQMYQLLSTDYETLLDKFRREKLTSDTWMMSAKQYESYKDLAREYEGRMKQAENRLKHYTRIEAMLQGVEDNVKEELANFPPTSDSVKGLLEMKHIFNAELRNASRKLDEFTRNFEALRSEKMKLKVQYEKKVKELKDLQHLFEIARINGKIRQRSNSPVPGPSTSTTSLETPKVFRVSKRKLQQPLPASVVDQSSPGLDADVDVFPSAFRKRGAAKATNSKSEPKLLKLAEKAPSKLQKFNVKPKENPSNNKTINLSSDSEEMDVSDDDDFKIRGSVPGAPLPLSSKRVKSLQEKAEKPTLGLSSRLKSSKADKHKKGF